MGWLKALFISVFVHFLGTGSLVAFITHRIAENHLKIDEQKYSGASGRLEWLYCFDIHCNAFLPVFLLLYVCQYLLLPVLLLDSVFSVLLSALLNIGSLVYYHYMICEGFSTLPFLKNTHVFLLPIVFWAFLGLLLVLARVNLTTMALSVHF